MKHEVTSLNTKKALSASLKRAMEKKPLSKITVTEIIGDCGVNRKTFYYHFEDIYGLLKWTLEQEALTVIKNFDLLVDYEEAISFVMDYVDENKHILNCDYDSMGSELMKRFFYADFFGIMQTVVEGAAAELGVSVSADFQDYLCRFYTEALSGMLIDYFKDRSARSRETTLKYVSLICRESIKNALLAFSETEK